MAIATRLHIDEWEASEALGGAMAQAEGRPAGSTSATIPGDVLRPRRRPRPTDTLMSRAPLRVAVLGAGTVGREVVRGLLEHPERLHAADGAPLVLTGVACRNLARARGAGIPSDLLTDAPAHLVAAPDTDIVVELMGGDEPARTLIGAALAAGKPVVTANKHVIAHHGADLELAARKTGAPLRFEGAVAGGIPILGPLASDLAANQVTRVRGIVNGTTNYILSLMAHAGRPYAEVLADAQAHGYAEADPAGDVEGDDAVNKLVILARLAFGQWLVPGTIERRPPTVLGWGRPGITGVTDRELSGAAALGLTIKLLATATAAATTAATATAATPTAATPTAATPTAATPTAATPTAATPTAATPTAATPTAAPTAPSGTSAFEPGPSQRPIAAAVLPTAIAATSPFGQTDGVTNRVEIDAEPIGTVAFSGPGAGGPATSSAVQGDLLAVARGLSSTWAGLGPAVGPAVAARESLQSARRWYAFLPGIEASAVPAGWPDLVQAVDHAGGLAVSTQPIALAAARRAVGSMLHDGSDVTLYPIDD